ncbi:TRAP transporter small permease [uncultured Albimonas sp.]|uniref:TRAP transporter small permease subunit n=1 Tax=uncultured Albimonas sp. TaxID=1331701 RepID=UPI0030EEFAE1|tara:strand:- start:16330 stop:16926 length:597 start_codon:yes stop_codon:yes gene_type:complete
MSRAILAWVPRAVDLCNRVMLAAAGVALGLMMVNTVADILGKYLLNQPVPGTIAIVSWYWMVSVAFMPVAYVQARREHLMVELFTMRLSPRAKAGMDVAVAAAGALYMGLLTWLVWEEALVATRRGEFQDITVMDLPVWPSRWILPAAFGLMTAVLAIQCVLDLIHAVTGRPPPTPPGAAAPEAARDGSHADAADRAL